ncbi:cation:proton antiporter [Corynebacterium lubricantis]|uniref:cation:proton antiporter n=1 Tax=Corynebacterium lubricantis TaxID=541095 RepID=UPI00036157DF|nr:monovalent cation/H(+) antiporter subunit G [Corynebacterium lubricantis]
MQVMNIIGDILIVVGALNFAICALGLVAFYDVYARISAVGTASGFGVSFVVLGIWFKDPSLWSFFIALFAVVVLLGTSAMGSLLIARSAVLRGTQMVAPIDDDINLEKPEVFEARKQEQEESEKA